MYTFPNQLGNLPQGALSKAINVVINREGVLELRRGFKLYGNSFGASSDTAHQLLTYKGRVLRHYGSSAGTTLQYDSDGAGTFASFSGSIAEAETGLRIKGLEQNSNLYFTASNGIKKISSASAAGLSSASITNAGGIKSLDISLSLNSSIGWFNQESIVAYRTLWGIKDANSNLILGSPSAQAIISNPLTYLLIKDFNKLLYSLDTAAAVAGGTLTNTTYLQTFKQPTTASATTLLSAMATGVTNLVDSLDTDMSLPAIATAPPTAGISGSGTVVTVTFTSAVDGGGTPSAALLRVGDILEIKNSNPTGYNGNWTIVTVSGSAITYASTFSTAYVGSATARRLKYTSLTKPASPADNTTAELLALQTYYNLIYSTLLGDSTAHITAAQQVAGNFQPATTTSTTNVKSIIPSGITTAHFFQIYRTAQQTSSGAVTLSSLDNPGDEQELVYEANPTATDIANGYMLVNDITPDSFRGADLYTNELTGEGLAQANEPPPFAKDIATFKNYTFYANTQTEQDTTFNLLSVSNFGSGTSKFTITDGVTTNTYTFVAGVAEISTITTVAESAGNYTGKYFTISTANDTTKYYIWFKVSGSGSDPGVTGRTGIEVDISNADTANTIASAIYKAMNKVNEWSIPAPGANVITVTNVDFGTATDINANTSPVTVGVSTQGVGEDATNKKVLYTQSTTFSPAQQVDLCAKSLCRVINQQAGEIVYAYYQSIASTVPGQIFLQARVFGGAAFYLLSNNATTGVEFTPDLSPTKLITNISIANPTVVTSTAHGLSTGNKIVISGSDSTPSIDGVYTVTSTGADTFTVPVNVTVGGTTGGWKLSSGTTVSTNEVSPNRLFYSKFQQPEAVPLTNYYNVGAKDKKILRILALRDNLFILKEEGIYRLSGNTVPFVITLFDSSTLLNAPDSASVLNNLIYLSSSQGIATISDTGVSIISRPIEDLLNKLPTYANFSTSTCGVGYESDRSYYLFTISASGDTSNKQCFKYNTFTNSWTTLDLSKRSAVVNTFDDKLYLSPTDKNYTEQERKSFTRTDYADRENTITINRVSGTSVVLNSVTGINVGDVIVQTQYLTCYQFNKLLLKLDKDTFLADSNYYSLLVASGGTNLSTQLDSLIDKIKADAGRLANGGTSAATYTALEPTSSDFASIQTNFNSLIALLNADAGVNYSDYLTSTGTVDKETVITAINTLTNTVTTLYPYPFIIGTATQYQHIAATVQWAPQIMQDPSLLKQVSEGTAIFASNNFTSATLSYSSDLSAGFEPTPFNGAGNGVFGSNLYGNSPFGGSGSGVPFRTLIPKGKQRCRYIIPKFTFGIARETFYLYGLSLSFNVSSTHAYR